jgi:hypothetical protein
MKIYLKDENEADKFDGIIDIAMKLFSGKKRRRATNGSCNMYVNDWAQELIFKVMVPGFRQIKNPIAVMNNVKKNPAAY